MGEMLNSMRPFFPFLLFVFVAFAGTGQTPISSELHRPSSFDNSYAGTLPVDAYARSFGEERYGFLAIFEVRVAPGVVKTLDVRQYFGSEELTVQGFMRVRASLSGQAHLVNVHWITPTEGGVVIGN